MRGHIRRRSKQAWTIVLDAGTKVDPETGKRKRNQQWIAVKGTKRDAEAKLAKLIGNVNDGDFVEPSRITFGDWLDKWYATAIKDKKKLRTAETYRSILRHHVKPSLGDIPLQKLTAVELESYYETKQHGKKPLSQGSLQMHQAIIHSALEAAHRKTLVARNVAKLVDGKPRAKKDSHEDVKSNCWEADEAKQFLGTARKAGPRPAAFYRLALETGMRKAELCGLKWEDLNLDEGQVSITRQLVKPGKEPVFGSVKNGWPRTLDLSLTTVKLLRALKGHQAEVKLRNRQAYRDHGLTFTKEWPDAGKKTDCLGDPLQQNNLGQREFAKLIDASGVRRIKFHGLRHTSATLALKAGVPVKVVAERLGHAKTDITNDIYAHALPSMQREAAKRISALLL